MLLFKDLGEDCDACPLYKEHICPGGWSGSPNGPIEPPCCGFDDDTDLDAWVEDYYARQEELEKARHQKWEAEQEKKRKAEIAKKKRNYLNYYCISERMAVDQAKKQLQAYQSSIHMARDLAFAFNMTNKMFGYKERYDENVGDSKEKELEAAYEEAKAVLKAKQKECRKTEQYKTIGKEEKA